MRRRLGFVLVLTGLALFLGSVGFFLYAGMAKASLSQLNRKADFVLEQPAPVDAQEPGQEPTSAPSQEPVPRRAQPPRYIYIPRVGISSKVAEVGTKWEDGKLVWEVPDYVAGYHQGSAFPGAGNTVLNGHLTSRYRGKGEVFKDLPQVVPGDEVFLYTDQEQFVYRVTETKVVKPEQVEVLEDTPDATVTLVTCVPDWIYTERLIVIGKLVRVSPLSGEALAS